MLSQRDIENKLTEIKPILTGKFFVDRIGYFGSYADGTATENSDLDILVEFTQPLGWEFFDLETLLEKKLQLKIDLVSAKALKPQLKEIILSQVRFV